MFTFVATFIILSEAVSAMSSVTKLNNGALLPMVGLGTWKSSKTEVGSAVRTAILQGYRHIDCASDYENEENVGVVLQSLFGKINRSDLFITTKLWNTYHRPEDVLPTFLKSLEKLKCNYIDLYLMHFPTGEDKEETEFPNLSSKERFVQDVDYVDTWKEMEKLLSGGLVRSIGVSNFNEYQLNRLIAEGNVVPAVNQIENHPYLIQKDLVQFCKSKNIHVTAYSPLGSIDRDWAKPNDPNLLKDESLITIANKYQKSVAQLLLKFQIQRGLSVIPKSVTTSHIIENIDLSFDISSSDMNEMLSLDRGWRALDASWIKDNKFFPFCDNYTESSSGKEEL